MSKLKEKSLINIEAASLLIDKNYYCSSVHCSYYSCFQLLKFIINDFFEVDYEALGALIAHSRKNSHRFIIEYIEQEVQENVNLQEARNFQHKIKDLKNFREESDYEDVEITNEQGRKAYNIAKELRMFLSNIFHV